MITNKEIEIIKSLKKSKSFLEFFSVDEIDTICNNVATGKRIFENIQRFRDYDQSLEQLKNRVDEQKKVIESIAELSTKDNMVHSSDIRRLIEPLFGQEYFIYHILKNSKNDKSNLLNLREKDIKYLQESFL